MFAIVMEKTKLQNIFFFMSMPDSLHCFFLLHFYVSVWFARFIYSFKSKGNIIYFHCDDRIEIFIDLTNFKIVIFLHSLDLSAVRAKIVDHFRCATNILPLNTIQKNAQCCMQMTFLKRTKFMYLMRLFTFQ